MRWRWLGCGSSEKARFRVCSSANEKLTASFMHSKWLTYKVDIERLSTEDCANLKLEIKVHNTLRHAHIVRFFDCLQVGYRVYTLLEYAANGCLFFYINSRTGLPEHIALRFLRQTALAVQHLHDKSIIHRDIKPENLLLDQDFNVKLCDFGWATQVEADRGFKTSICGTYEYMSPEIVFERVHTAKTDIWCLGVLFYEMLHGKPPFKAGDFEGIRKEFEEKRIEISSHFSAEAKALLKMLLEPDPRRRPDIAQVLQHPALARSEAASLRPLSPADVSLLVATYLLNTNNGQTHDPPEIVVKEKLAIEVRKLDNFFDDAARDMRHDPSNFFADVSLEFDSPPAAAFAQTASNQSSRSQAANAESGRFLPSVLATHTAEDVDVVRETSKDTTHAPTESSVHRAKEEAKWPAKFKNAVFVDAPPPGETPFLQKSPLQPSVSADLSLPAQMQSLQPRARTLLLESAAPISSKVQGVMSLQHIPASESVEAGSSWSRFQLSELHCAARNPNSLPACRATLPSLPTAAQGKQFPITIDAAPELLTVPRTSQSTIFRQPYHRMTPALVSSKHPIAGSMHRSSIHPSQLSQSTRFYTPCLDHKNGRGEPLVVNQLSLNSGQQVPEYKYVLSNGVLVKTPLAANHHGKVRGQSDQFFQSSGSSLAGQHPSALFGTKVAMPEYISSFHDSRPSTIAPMCRYVAVPHF